MWSHPCPGNCLATGRVVVYCARADHAFSAGIQCRYCSNLRIFLRQQGLATKSVPKGSGKSYDSARVPALSPPLPSTLLKGIKETVALYRYDEMCPEMI